MPAFIKRVCNAHTRLCQLLLQWLFCAAMTVPRVITGELVFKEVDDAKKRTESFDEARELRSDSQA